MKARATLAVVVLFLIAEGTMAGGVDKAKLRELAHLPKLSFFTGFSFSTISGLAFGENPDHQTEIARLQKQLKGDPSDAERYLLLGRHYSKMKREKEAKEAWKKAVAICREQVREHPDDVSWAVQLSDALGYDDKAKEGEKLLRRAVREAPNDWRGCLALADSVNRQSFHAIFGNKHVSFAIRDEKMIFPALLERKPTEKQIAEMLRLRTEAQRLYERAVELAPQDQVKPYQRRLSSNWLHTFIEAGIRISRGEKINLLAAFLDPDYIPDIRHIARLSPDDPQAVGPAMFWEILVCVCQNNLQMKQDLSSWADYLAIRRRTLVEVLPAESHDFVCWCMERLAQLTNHSDKDTAAAASEIVAEGLMTITTIGEGLEVSGPISSIKKDIWTMALGYLRHSVKRDPSRERAWDLLTMMLAAENKTEEALAVANKRLSLKDTARNRFLLAKIYADNHQFDKAAEELYAGVQNDPKDLYCGLGSIALMLKREDKQSLQKAGEQLKEVLPRMNKVKDKQLWLDYYLLGALYCALDDRPDDAVKTFEQILQRMKGEPTATRALAALGKPPGPNEQQRAVDFITELGGRVERKDVQATSSVVGLHLSRAIFADDDLFVLTAFPRLRELNLSSSAVTDAGLNQLTGLSDLCSLRLDDTNVTDNGLIALGALRGLRDLSLVYANISDAGLSHLTALQDLESLYLLGPTDAKEGKPITDAGLAHLRNLRNLRTLMVGSSITDKGLAQLAAMPQLRELFMLSSEITDEGMYYLERLADLETLWLSDAQITDAGLAHLKALRNLKRLHLGGTKITDAGLVHLKELSQVEELELDSTAVSDAGLVHLCGLTNLRKLNLRDCEHKNAMPTGSNKPALTGTGLMHLYGLTKLKYLELDGRPITDAGLIDIEKLSQVEHLSLGTTAITDESLTHLQQLKHLQFVNVRSTKVTRQGIAELRKALPKLEVYR